jgi:hypothetical protein
MRDHFHVSQFILLFLTLSNCQLFVRAFVQQSAFSRQPRFQSLQIFTSQSNEFGFEQIRSLDGRLEKLELISPDILNGFYEPDLKSFSLIPGTVQVSSTA